jgi:diguanylate cyclase (GGDEF)-like protein
MGGDVMTRCKMARGTKSLKKSRNDTTATIQGDLRPAAATGLGATACLIVLAGWEIGRVIELTREETVIGRSETADIPIPEPLISRRHARILHLQIGDNDFYEVADLESSNGTFVNHAAVPHSTLVDGDRLQIGSVLFKFVLRDEAEGAFYRDVHRVIHHDQLTGLLTMESFLRRVRPELAPARVLTLAMTDLDGLKRVNDTYGHLAGRMVVGEMGVMFRSVLRTGDVAALYGGDEAVIAFPKTPLGEAALLAEELRLTVAGRRFEHAGNEFSVTISQGLAQCPEHGRTAEELIAAADRALYAAKAAGRNCVRTA